MRSVLVTGLLAVALLSSLTQAAGLDTELASMPESASVAEQTNPFDAVTLNNLAVERANKGDYKVAIMLLERASTLSPERQDIRDNLAELRAWSADNGSLQSGAKRDLYGEPPALWSAAGKSKKKASH